MSQMLIDNADAPSAAQYYLHYLCSHFLPLLTREPIKTVKPKSFSISTLYDIGAMIRNPERGGFQSRSRTKSSDWIFDFESVTTIFSSAVNWNQPRPQLLLLLLESRIVNHPVAMISFAILGDAIVGSHNVAWHMAFIIWGYSMFSIVCWLIKHAYI